MYYVLRKTGEPEKPTYALSKWEEGRNIPSDVYQQWIPYSGRSGRHRVHSCNCPSRSNPCKHEVISLALLSGAMQLTSDECPLEEALAGVYYDAESGLVKQAEDLYV